MRVYYLAMVDTNQLIDLYHKKLRELVGKHVPLKTMEIPRKLPRYVRT